MFQNDLLDVAIGLVFVWFVLSLVLSVVNEALVLTFRVRSKHLWLAIGRIVDPVRGEYGRRFWDTVIRLPFSIGGGLDMRPLANACTADPKGFFEWVKKAVGKLLRKPAELLGTTGNAELQHPSLQQIYDGLSPMVSDVASAGRRSKLTSIPAGVFANAVAAIASRVHPADLIEAARVSFSGAQLARLTTALASIPPEKVISLTDTVDLDLGSDRTESDKRELYFAASQIFTARDIADVFKDNPALADAVMKAATAAGVIDRIAAAKKAVGDWYDREMEQLSALYRRQSRLVLAILAIPVVLIFEANTLGIVSDLRSDSALRQAVASQATATVDADKLKDVVDEQCPPESTDNAAEVAAKKVECVGKIIQAAQKSILIVPDLDKVRGLDVGDGWFFGLSWGDVAEYETQEAGLLGRLITLVALMFGAQFWFDVLRRLVGIRTTLTKGGSAAG